MSMKELISKWDAKNTDYITEIYQKFESDKSFLDDLILFMQIVPMQRGASWLIKHFVDGGGKLNQSQSAKLVSLIDQFEHWETKLHFLQILPSFEITDEMKKPIFEFLIEGVASEAKFVRAWSYGGLILLSEQHKEYRDIVLSYLEKAQENEAASIKARIRQASKKSDYWKNKFQ